MYDLHCHILPGIDDGPVDWQSTIALARALVADGVTHVAATPHGPGSTQSFKYNPNHLRELVTQLREHLQRAKVGLQVMLGTELVLDVGLAGKLRDGALLGYGSSRTILLETPNHVVMAYLEQAIFELQLAGYRVVLAHPERTRLFQDDPNLLIPLVERGVIIQVTAASLAGLHGERLKQVSTQMVAHNLAHIIASDAHSATGKRAPAMQAAFAAVSQLVGETTARHMLEALPQMLLSDSPLPYIEPHPVNQAKPRWRWGK